ncbi:carboxymuconolactone decarboxylase family protein [Yunchengibacter salinarum]|uniref:carboxymuconolactone decarboxylase family protein n=1 Tax=Yunchengibacter salinarum TaxID=3133399 RepID=UPI0035B59035
MTFFPSIPDNGHLADVFRTFDKGLEPLLAFHDAVLRGESDLTIGQREMIAAYVSALNDCAFCYNSHRAYAAAFGIDHTVFDRLVDDLDSAPIDEELKPLLSYVRKLTRLPYKMTQDDVDAVLNAGWSESALHDAILVTNLFNFMNRVIFAHGLPDHEALYRERLEGHLQKSLEDRQKANETALGSDNYQSFGTALKAEKKG